LSERSEVKRDGAKAQKNSGRGEYQKGDAKWNQFKKKLLIVDKKDIPKLLNDTYELGL
jgi:hypothetical protein